MKNKKQKMTTPTTTKKNNKNAQSHPPLHKEFELIYRTCDRLPSSQQYQSVLFLKRKKITTEDHSSVQQTKSKKKKQSGKKKKIEEKVIINDKLNTTYGKSQSLSNTKSTMPSTALGFLKKSTFADTFKQKINLDRSSIKKVNNLSNSNSSRYLSSKLINKQDRNSIKNDATSSNKIPKSPKNKNSPHKMLSNSNKSIENQINYASSNRVRYTRSKNQKNDKIIENDKFKDFQYAYIDGEYIQIDKPSADILTQKVISQNQINDSSNQFIRNFQKFKSNFEDILPQRKQLEKNKTEISEISQKTILNSDEYLEKIILIQKWWKKCLSKKKIQQCNNVKHFPSVVESQKSVSNINPSPRAELDNSFNNQQNNIDTPRRQESLINFIKTKQSLILNHMQSQKQILNKLLELRKIDTYKYSQSLMEVQSIFQKEMNQVSKLKLKIQAENQKMQQLKIKIKQKSQILSKLQKIPTSIILKNFFDPSQVEQNNQSEKSIGSDKPSFQRQKSTGCHYSLLSQPNKNQTSNKIISYRKVENQKQAQDSHENEQKQQAGNQEEQESHSGQEQVENSQQNAEQNVDPVKITHHILELYADRQQAQSEIQKRYASQLGIGYQFSNSNKSIVSTSVIGIHNFLMNFLKFYEYFYKDQFLKIINIPYGYNPKTRIKILQGYTPEKWQKKEQVQENDQQVFFKVQSIIGEQILDDFHEHNYHLPQDIDDATKAMIYFQKIHQRAVIDGFNECLNSFRPYYFINGAPYTWNYSQKALTFYYIAQQNIQQVFQKTQYKVLKNASSLCGTIVENLIQKPQITEQMNFQQQFSKYRESINPVLIQTREEKLGKIEKQQIQQQNYKWEYYEQEKTQLMFFVAQSVLSMLLGELLEIKPLGPKYNQSLYQVYSQKEKSNSETQSVHSQSQPQSSQNINNSSSENSNNYETQQAHHQQINSQPQSPQNQDSPQQQVEEEDSQSSENCQKVQIEPILFGNDGQGSPKQQYRQTERQRQQQSQQSQGEEEQEQEGLEYEEQQNKSQQNQKD